MPKTTKTMKLEPIDPKKMKPPPFDPQEMCPREMAVEKLNPNKYILRSYWESEVVDLIVIVLSLGELEDWEESDAREFFDDNPERASRFLNLYLHCFATIRDITAAAVESYRGTKEPDGTLMYNTFWKFLSHQKEVRSEFIDLLKTVDHEWFSTDEIQSLIKAEGYRVKWLEKALRYCSDCKPTDLSE